MGRKSVGVGYQISKDNTLLRAIDLFAGIGAFRLALDRNGFRTVLSSEIHGPAKDTYESNFGDRPLGDIRLIDTALIPDHELLVGGFPCQTFSQAGVSKLKSLGRPHGLMDQTRGTLFFEVARILRDKRPAAFLLENVKNLVHHDHGQTIQVILSTLHELGYHVFHQVIDAVHWVPQHRKRIFIVGFAQKSTLATFVRLFDQKLLCEQNTRSLADILESNPDQRLTLSNKVWTYLQKHANDHRDKGNGFGFRMFQPIDKATRTLSARYGKDGSEILISQDPSYRNPNGNPRRLSVRECARLMGFPDTFLIPVSDTSAYRQFGNAVVVPLVTDLIGVVKDAMTADLQV
jgi:DNA (cytosine-5)-methyltransferase 1